MGKFRIILSAFFILSIVFASTVEAAGYSPYGDYLLDSAQYYYSNTNNYYRNIDSHRQQDYGRYDKYTYNSYPIYSYNYPSYPAYSNNNARYESYTYTRITPHNNIYWSQNSYGGYLNYNHYDRNSRYNIYWRY